MVAEKREAQEEGWQAHQFQILRHFLQFLDITVIQNLLKSGIRDVIIGPLAHPLARSLAPHC